MAALASDWLIHFRLLLCNRWTEFNETWQEARSQRHLPSLFYSRRSQKQDGRPGLWLAETVFTSFLKPLNRIQRNLTGSKILTSSTKFVLFRPMSKQKFPPFLICQKGGTLYSGARYVALWASCCLSYSPFGPSNTGNTQFYALFFYMLWHIELKFCICFFTVLQIKFECLQFPSIFVGVMPLLWFK